MSENTNIYIIVGITAVMLLIGVIAAWKLIKGEVSKDDAK